MYCNGIKLVKAFIVNHNGSFISKKRKCCILDCL